MAPRDQYRERILIALAVVVAIGFGANTVWRACYAQAEHSDFPVYLAAGRAVLDGTDLYQVLSARGWHYAYPPPFAILMAPFALVPKPLASLLWYTVSVGLFVHSLRMCIVLAGDARLGVVDPFTLYVVPPLLVIWPLASGLERGQTTVLMLWLIVAAVYTSGRRPIVGAICFAGAILLRVFPGILLPYFAWRGHWRFVALTAAAVALLGLGPPAIVFGWKQNVHYWHEWATGVASPVVDLSGTATPRAVNDGRDDPLLARNQSLSAVLRRVSGSPKAPLVALAIGALMALATFATATSGRVATEWIVVAQLLVWMLLIIPLSWGHYFVLLLLPLTILTTVAAAHADVSLRNLARAALVIFAALGLTGGLWEASRFYGPLCWGSFGLWIVLVFATWRTGRLETA